MNPKFEQIEIRYQALQERLADPAVQSSSEYQELAREFKRCGPAVQKVRTLRQSLLEIHQAEGLLASSEPDLRALAEEELRVLRERVEGVSKELEDFLIPRDPRDARDVIIEIRAGTGGDEAAIFAGDLFRMYSRYAVEKGFSVEPYTSSPSGLGGYKEIVFGVQGLGAYSRFKFESGVHRVQRVPDTEAQGRIHTSTATVAVLPEADEVEVSINPADLRIDTYRASGAGGQHINKTDSAVRITHNPSGIVVQCQNDRSQHRNRAEAMAMLKSRLYEAEVQKRQADQQKLEDAKTDIGWGHQIRSYVLDQSRIKDLRTNVEVGNTQSVLDGDLDQFIEASLKQGV